MSTLAVLRFSPLPNLRRLSPAAFPLRPTPLAVPHRRTPALRPLAAVPASDRLISIAAYTLPFIDSLHYGHFLFARFPIVTVAVSPLLPLAAAYRSVPFAAFVAFFALYLGVVRNENLSRYVRFNAMQAVVLDVLLALPSLVQRVVGVPTARGVGLRIMELGYGLVFGFAALCYVFSVMNCVLGRTPVLPFVASAAERQF